MPDKTQEWKPVNILKEQYELIKKLVKIPYVKAVCAQNVTEFTHFAIAEKIKEIVKNLKGNIPDEENSE